MTIFSHIYKREWGKKSPELHKSTVNKTLEGYVIRTPAHLMTSKQKGNTQQRYCYKIPWQTTSQKLAMHQIKTNFKKKKGQRRYSMKNRTRASLAFAGLSLKLCACSINIVDMGCKWEENAMGFQQNWFQEFTCVCNLTPFTQDRSVPVDKSHWEAKCSASYNKERKATVLHECVFTCVTDSLCSRVLSEAVSNQFARLDAFRYTKINWLNVADVKT